MSRRVPRISTIQHLVGFRPKADLDEILERVIRSGNRNPTAAMIAGRVPAALVGAA